MWRSNPFPLTRLLRLARNDAVPTRIVSALHNSSKGISSQGSWGFASLELEISDSVLKEAIRLKEAEHLVIRKEKRKHPH